MMLNCDLGESFGAWTMPVDEKIMVYIDQANIACGYHGGDPLAIQSAIGFARSHEVAIGAHPSYPDLQGFGRRSMAMKKNELIACLHYQIAAVDGMARAQGGRVEYVKPHGALYNDMMKNTELRHHVMEAISSYSATSLPLMVQAHPTYERLNEEAAQYGVILMFEAFADRRYTDDGYLTPRSQANAVLNETDALEQAILIMEEQTIISEHGKRLTMPVDTLCVHGDSPGAIAMAESVRIALTKRKLNHVKPNADA